MATVVALSFRVAGLIATPWTTILLIGGSATAVAIVCWQIVRRGWHEPLGVVFDVFWIAIDIGFISVTVAVTGGARSPWMPWYLAILSAAVFVRGQVAAFLTFVGGTAGYMLALRAAGDLGST